MEKYNKVVELLLKGLENQLDFLMREDIEPKRAHFQQLRWTIDDIGFMFYAAFEDLPTKLKFTALVKKVEELQNKRY